MVWGDEKHIEGFVNEFRFERLSVLYSGSQFDSAGTRRGVLKGYFLRALDCTNLQKHKVRWIMMRLAAGLQKARYESHEVRNTMKRAECEGYVGFGWAYDGLEMDEKSRDRVCYVYDLLRKQDCDGAQLQSACARL